MVNVRKNLQVAGLVAALLGVLGAGPVAAVVLIDDDFANSGHYWIWTTGFDGDGEVGYSPDAQNLELRSASTIGATTWMKTVRQYDTASGSQLALRVRCMAGEPMGPQDDSFWGFQRTVGGQDYSIGFLATWIDGQGAVLLARARAGAQSAAFTVPSPSWSQSVDYRIDVQEGSATFFVNGSQVWAVTSFAVPQGLLDVRLEKTSPGRARALSVDSVALDESWLRSRYLLSVGGPGKQGGLRAADEGGRAEATWGTIKAAYRD